MNMNFRLLEIFVAVRVEQRRHGDADPSAAEVRRAALERMWKRMTSVERALVDKADFQDATL